VIETNRVALRPTSADTAEPVSRLRGGRLWAVWFGVVTVGEFLGFAVPAVIGATTAHAPAGVAFPALLAAGAVEGTLLGLAQAYVLRRAIDGIRTGRWVAASAGAAVVAYAVGMAPSSTSGLLETLPPAVLAMAAAVLGTVLLLSIGTAQWLVLRTLVRHATRWIATTALAWTAGLGVFLGFTVPLWHPGQSVAAIAAIGVAGGLLMAATTSAITGEALRRLLAHHRD
jgi:uncharacterized integral membrane protein